MRIQKFTLQLIIQASMEIGYIPGTMSVSEFVRQVFPKANNMPTTDFRFGMKTAIDDIRQHMDDKRVCDRGWNR